METQTTNHRSITAMALLAALGLLVGCDSDSTFPTQPQPPSVSASSALSAQTGEAMAVAIEDEYKARAFYEAVIHNHLPAFQLCA